MCVTLTDKLDTDKLKQDNIKKLKTSEPKYIVIVGVGFNYSPCFSAYSKEVNINTIVDVDCVDDFINNKDFQYSQEDLQKLYSKLDSMSPNFSSSAKTGTYMLDEKLLGKLESVLEYI